MKHGSFKVEPDRGGWLRTTLCPINEKRHPAIRFIDLAMFAALICTTFAIARVLIAH